MIKIYGSSLGQLEHNLSNYFVMKNFYGVNILWYLKNTNEIFIDDYIIISDVETYKIYQRYKNKYLNGLPNKIFLSHKEGYLSLKYNNDYVDDKNIKGLAQEFNSHFNKEIKKALNNKYTENKIDNIINCFIFSLNPLYTNIITLTERKYSEDQIHTLKDYNKDQNNELFINDNKIYIKYYNNDIIENYLISNDKILSILLLSPASIFEILIHILDNLIYLNLNNVVKLVKELYYLKYKIKIDDNVKLYYVNKYGKDSYINFQNEILKYMNEQYSNEHLYKTDDILIDKEFGVLMSNDDNFMGFFSNWHNNQIRTLLNLYINKYVPEFINCYYFQANYNNLSYKYIGTINKTSNKNDKILINSFYINNIIEPYKNKVNNLTKIIKQASKTIYNNIINQFVEITKINNKVVYENMLTDLF